MATRMTDHLYVGDRHDAMMASSQLRSSMFKSVVVVAEEVNVTAGINCNKVGLSTGKNSVPLLLAALYVSEASCPPTLVACSEGVGRSVAVATALLCMRQGMPWDQGIAHARSLHPALEVNDHLRTGYSQILRRLRVSVFGKFENFTKD